MKFRITSTKRGSDFLKDYPFLKEQVTTEAWPFSGKELGLTEIDVHYIELEKLADLVMLVKKCGAELIIYKVGRLPEPVIEIYDSRRE